MAPILSVFRKSYTRAAEESAVRSFFGVAYPVVQSVHVGELRLQTRDNFSFTALSLSACVTIQTTVQFAWLLLLLAAYTCQVPAESTSAPDAAGVYGERAWL